MKLVKIRFTREASRHVSKLHPEVKKIARVALDELGQNPYRGTELQAELQGFWSVRAKRYRILYNINEEDNYIEVLYVGHRRDIFEQFRQILNKLQ